jgi:hypothetical protein
MATKTTEKKVEEAVKAVADDIKKAHPEGCCGGNNNKYNMNSNASSGAVYGLGLIGALVFFIQQADTFGQGLFGVLKALVWPAILVYEALSKLI